MIALLFWLGVIGVFFDWRSMRRGGPPPSADEKRSLVIAVALCVATLIGLALIGVRSAALGEFAALLSAIVLSLWSTRRYLARRRPILRTDRTGPA